MVELNIKGNHGPGFPGMLRDPALLFISPLNLRQQLSEQCQVEVEQWGFEERMKNHRNV